MYVEGQQPQSKPHETTQGRSQRPPRCANCEIDILWPATVVQGKTYCCTGCAAGGPCTCDYSEYRSVQVSGVIYYGVECGSDVQTRTSRSAGRQEP